MNDATPGVVELMDVEQGLDSRFGDGSPAASQMGRQGLGDSPDLPTFRAFKHGRKLAALPQIAVSFDWIGLGLRCQIAARSDVEGSRLHRRERDAAFRESFDKFSR